MSLIKFFNNFLLLIIVSNSAFSSIVEEKCGEHLYIVQIINDKDVFETSYNLFYKKKGQKKILFYKSESGIHLLAACVQNKSKENLMLFQEFCGGNGCPEDMYGLFNPQTKKILLNPSDYPKGNQKQADRILGYSTPFLVDDKRSFCCKRKRSLSN